MTVKELIEKLQEYPEKTIVTVQVYDADIDAADVREVLYFTGPSQIILLPSWYRRNDE